MRLKHYPIETKEHAGIHTVTHNNPALQPVEIGHPEYICLIEPDTAFWALVKRKNVQDILADGNLMRSYLKEADSFKEEMDLLRFSKRPSAVYFNPTERCNLNCSYCYIPGRMRQNGKQMSEKKLFDAMGILKDYFTRTLPNGVQPQVVFHGAEPLINRDAVFSAIDRYQDDFLFGVQTNATLLDDVAVEFLTARKVSIGISLDAPTSTIADRTRKNWKGDGCYQKVVEAMERLRGYPNWSVICTITTENIRYLTKTVEFFHRMEAPTCMLNIVRCTLKPSYRVKPADEDASKHYLSALDRTYELYLETGRKLPIANFANILLAIIAPTARRLMCDISPCGGGRCFFALSPNGDLFPCSEFIGLEDFKGGNIFETGIENALASHAFNLVTERKIENIQPCANCAIRHFCGAPCPAETDQMNKGMNQRGAFCKFYEEQVRYAFRLIAENKQDAYLWDGWEKGTKKSFDFSETTHNSDNRRAER